MPLPTPLFAGCLGGQYTTARFPGILIAVSRAGAGKWAMFAVIAIGVFMGTLDAVRA